MCAELGLDPKDVNQKTMLNLARVAAHTVGRPAAPVTAYVLGIAVDRGEPLAETATNSISLPADGRLTTDPRRQEGAPGIGWTSVCSLRANFPLPMGIGQLIDPAPRLPGVAAIGDGEQVEDHCPGKRVVGNPPPSPHVDSRRTRADPGPGR
jgi:Domain of unknown function (DUF6457)